MTWTKRWGYTVKPTKTPGVLRVIDGRYLVHGKVGRDKRLVRVVPASSERAAAGARLAMLAEARQKKPTLPPLFSEYAPLLYERKVVQGELKSAKTRDQWDDVLTLHLLPAFGRFRVDAITKVELEQWKNSIAKRITAKKLSPRTANGWLKILLHIIRSAIDDYELPRDPTRRVRAFPLDEHPTYTEEYTNSLTLEQTSRFLVATRRLYPQLYAMVLLGFVTGLRPSTLRALRRRGAEPDVLWTEGALLVRRSNALGQEVMNSTKTGTRYKLGLSPEVVRELEAHAVGLKRKKKASELLFPSTRGGFMSRSTLNKLFARVSEAIGLSFTLSPRGMRRTYQDLARGAGVEKTVRRAICGHETEAMSDLYSTVRVDEMAEAVGRIARAVGPVRAA